MSQSDSNYVTLVPFGNRHQVALVWGEIYATPSKGLPRDKAEREAREAAKEHGLLFRPEAGIGEDTIQVNVVG